MKIPVAACLALFLALTAPAGAADVELWRLDCGRIAVRDLNAFSDTYAYVGQSRTLTDSCYLIRHDHDYMLWDTGLPAGLLGAKLDTTQPMAPTLDADLPSQLARIGVKPDQVGTIGISHSHFDHTGQAAAFPKATLLIGAADLPGLKSSTPPFGVVPATLTPWLQGSAKLDPVNGDRDIFGDGSVVMLAAPGHTPGETALLVHLAKTGAVLLSGDVVHFEQQFANHGVPPFNDDRAESLASMNRLQALATNLHATVIVQHDPDDVAKLPAFPQSAR